MKSEEIENGIKTLIFSVLFVVVIVWITTAKKESIDNDLGKTTGEIYDVYGFDGNGRGIKYKYIVNGIVFYESSMIDMAICDEPADCVGKKVTVEYEKSKPSNSRIVVSDLIKKK